MADLPGRGQCLIKINLTLHVGAIQADGYHPVESLCAFIPGGDELIVGPRSDAFSLKISGPRAHELAATDTSDNLVVRGAKLIADATGVEPRSIMLTKRVPSASGLGGGTANGTEVMCMLNELAPRPLSAADLISLARALGADGPVCMAASLLPRPVPLLVAQGIGEQVSSGPSFGPFSLCVANPGRAVSTGAVFSAFDRAPLAGGLAHVQTQNGGGFRGLSGQLRRTRNDLAPLAKALEPSIIDLEQEMLATPGCVFARMSGSGASIFGIFPGRAAAAKATRRLQSAGRWAVYGDTGGQRPCVF